MTNTLADKVFIITGANAGIGLAASRQLAEKGGTVIMACRSRERGEKARSLIASQTGSEQVHMMLVDMSSQDSIQSFAAGFKQRFSRLDALVNNAAHFDISQKEPAFTPEGAETVFATNHLGPFLLTNLLMDSLNASASGRVINISSQGLMMYPFMKINFEDLSVSKKREFKVSYAYYHSKLAHVMFSRELARRLEGTGVICSAVRVPNVRVDVSRYPDLPKIALWAYDIKQRFAITPEEMGAVYTALAASPEYADLNGAYIDEKLKQVGWPGYSNNEDACRRLWEISEKMTGLD